MVVLKHYKYNDTLFRKWTFRESWIRSGSQCGHWVSGPSQWSFPSYQVCLTGINIFGSWNNTHTKDAVEVVLIIFLFILPYFLYHVCLFSVYCEIIETPSWRVMVGYSRLNQVSVLVLAPLADVLSLLEQIIKVLGI